MFRVYLNWVLKSQTTIVYVVLDYPYIVSHHWDTLFYAGSLAVIRPSAGLFLMNHRQRAPQFTGLGKSNQRTLAR